MNRLAQIWQKVRERTRGVSDRFSAPTAEVVTISPLRNDQGAGLRLTHINNRPVVVDEPIDLTDFTVTVSASASVVIESVGSYTGPVRFSYRFTDGRTSGVAQIVGTFT